MTYACITSIRGARRSGLEQNALGRGGERTEENHFVVARSAVCQPAAVRWLPDGKP
jgi:hypothetical protein